MANQLVIFGGSGGLGTPLCDMLQAKYALHEVVKVSSKDVDIRNEQQVSDFLDVHKPSIVLNLAVKNIDSLVVKQNMEDVKTQVDVNIKGNYHILKHSMRVMQELKKGRFIYVSSILADKPIQGTSVYAATKAFNENLMRTCALENARFGITVNNVRLGYFEKGLIEKVPEDILKQVMKTIPLRRLGTVRELFNAVDFLLNTEYITGSTITVAGGL